MRDECDYSARSIYGVCRCDLDAYEPKVEDLVKFDSYDDAYAYYNTKLVEATVGYHLPDDLWLVYIDDEDDTIIQFDQLRRYSKCRFVEIKN